MGMMKMAFLFATMLASALAHGNTCPVVSDIYSREWGNYYRVNPPVGWHLGPWNNRLYKPEILQFGIAAWGENLHAPIPNDSRIRCYYYSIPLDEENQVSLESDNIIPESQIQSRPGWNHDRNYYICGDDAHHDVGTCSFN